MKTFLVHIVLFLTLLGTSIASKNSNKEGNTFFLFQITNPRFPVAYAAAAANVQGACKSRYFS